MARLYASLEHDRALSSLLNSRGGCLLPIPTCRSSLPDWTVLINCQLDWLQIFIICDDWANLDSNLNQRCWRTAAGRDFSSLQEVHRYCTQSSDFMLQMRPNPPKHQLSSYAGPLEEAEYERRASLHPQWLTTNATLTILAFWGKFCLSCAFWSWPISILEVWFCYWRCWVLWRKQL